MLTFAFLVVLFVHGFWIWLGLAVVLALVAFGAKAARRGILFALAALSGLVGTVGGCVAVGTVSTEDRFEAEVTQYFTEACTARARVELPHPPLAPQLAVRWIRDRADAKPLLSRTQLSSLSGPGDGQYHAVETVGEYAPEFDTTIEGVHQPVLRAASRPEPLPDGLVRYSVRNRLLTHADDSRHGVEAIETVVTDVQSDIVVARRVALGRGPHRGSSTSAQALVCPGPEVEGSGCVDGACEIAPFLTKAVPPVPAASR